MNLDVRAIWWRYVQAGEFFNIERSPDLITGGGGARYIEIPSSMVMETEQFLGVQAHQSEPAEATIYARTIGAPDLGQNLEFKRKAGGRLRIANQNRQATPDLRHPAWRADRGFPVAPDHVQTSEEASAFYPDGGLRIYIVRTPAGLYFAGFTAGHPPEALPADHVMRTLYQGGVGGVIWF